VRTGKEVGVRIKTAFLERVERRHGRRASSASRAADEVGPL